MAFTGALVRFCGIHPWMISQHWASVQATILYEFENYTINISVTSNRWMGSAMFYICHCCVMCNSVFKTQSKKLSVLLPWISNHKHKIEENLEKVPGPPPKLSASGRRTGSNLEHWCNLKLYWLVLTGLWCIQESLVYLGPAHGCVHHQLLPSQDYIYITYTES